MTAITVFNGLFCDAGPVLKHILDITGFRLVTDQEIIADAASLSGLDEKSMARAVFYGAAKGDSGLDREQVIGWLRFAMARKLSQEKNAVFSGFMALLPPPEIDNILRVCLISGMNDRLWIADRDKGYPEEEAREIILADDMARCEWVMSVTECNDPWSPDLYDLVIPVGAVGIEQSARMVVEQLAAGVVQDSEATGVRLEDFLRNSEVEAALAGLGHDISVSGTDGALTLTFESHERTLATVTRNVLDSVLEMDGVESAEIGLGANYCAFDVLGREGQPVLPRKSGPEKILSARDHALAGSVRAALAAQGHDIEVHCRGGAVSLAVNSHRKMLESVSRSLGEFVSAYPGVEGVEFGVGRMYHRPDGYGRVRRERAAVLLAADDRKFEPTLSNRLRNRANIGAYAVSDGKSMLKKVKEIKPDVMVLDAKRVRDADLLRRVRKSHPETEVLVISGVRSEMDRDAFMDSGAFAYLPKPVNTAALHQAIRAAREKSRSRMYA
ncbi:MAG: response regulator [Pseudodesulfovibrio sp.]|uniref:response regulator n=1 Tax=Pseudodesulfovibrio sp. TaxID=2035812 RepID=UPI003D10CB68